MQDPYFRNFWITLKNGQELYPQLITNTKNGNPRYQVYPAGAVVDQTEPEELENPIDAIRAFVSKGMGLRFGRSDEEPAVYEPDDEAIQEHGMNDDLRRELFTGRVPDSGASMTGGTSEHRN